MLKVAGHQLKAFASDTSDRKIFQAGTPHSFFRGARSHLEPGNFCSALRVTIHKDLTALNYSTHKEHFFSSNYKMLQ
ncbi:hypothetical protein Q9966_010508 [Columba livia]|nr:hypothetical protein Q9966_010508 [Columba livia]